MNEHLGGSLSALIDGSLDAAERAAADAHLRACATCRAEADALRATLADLRALERPVLAETDRARLRSEVRRARRVPRSVLRLAAAATVVAVAAGGAMLLTRDGGKSPAGTFAAAIVEDGNYTEEMARALLLSSGTAQSAKAPTSAREAADSKAGGPSIASAPGGAATPPADGAAIPNIDHSARIARCEGIFLGTDDVIRVRRIVSRYEGEPAYLLTYRAPKDEPTHTELWVVSIEGCEIRFFAQEDL